VEQKKKIIGTTTYLVTQLDAVSSLKIQTKLIKILGASVLTLAGEEGSIKEKIGSVLPLMVENFDDEVVNDLVLSLFAKNVFTEIKGIPQVVDFATHFAGKAIEMWKVAGFILEANFSLGELLGSSSLTTPPEVWKVGS